MKHFKDHFKIRTIEKKFVGDVRQRGKGGVCEKK